MFDIGFGELLVCAIVALLVLGPERLPGAVRTVGRWVGRMRYSVNQFSEQIEREMRAEELRRRLEEEMKRAGVEDMRDEVRKALNAPLNVPHPRADAGPDAVPAADSTTPAAPAAPAVPAAATTATTGAGDGAAAVPAAPPAAVPPVGVARDADGTPRPDTGSKTTA